MTILLSIESVSKSYGRKQVVTDLSFQVAAGEIFGLLGPNGAGKTTTIRMALDLIRPDSGRITILGGALDAARKNRVGYMPEQAGLYDDMRLRDCLVYLATLKDLSNREAGQRVETALERLGLAAERRSKLKDLSRGMYQKAQIIAAIVHDPDLLIVDEPFANLDPVNAQVVRDELLALRGRGKSVIMSSHQMQLVESLCDRMVLVHQGRAVLYGGVLEVKQQFAEAAVWVAGRGDFANLPGVARATAHPQAWKLELQPGVTAADLLRALAARPEWEVERFERVLPSLDEIFVRTVQAVAPHA